MSSQPTPCVRQRIAEHRVGRSAIGVQASRAAVPSPDRARTARPKQAASNAANARRAAEVQAKLGLALRAGPRPQPTTAATESDAADPGRTFKSRGGDEDRWSPTAERLRWRARCPSARSPARRMTPRSRCCGAQLACHSQPPKPLAGRIATQVSCSNLSASSGRSDAAAANGSTHSAAVEPGRRSSAPVPSSAQRRERRKPGQRAHRLPSR